MVLEFLPKTIKALQLQEDKANPIKVIEIPFATEDKVQNLDPEEIIIKVKAIGLNPTDWKHAIGPWGTPGTISGCDSAGEVVKLGSAVKHLKLGDRVAGFTYGGSFQTDNGSYAEYVRLIGAVCFKLPDGMTYEEAASFPIPHLTAIQALYLRLKLPLPSSSDKVNESILIWGGNTAVATHAIQLARLAGLKVFVTASPQTHDILKSLGASECFDYKDTDVADKIRTAAGESGIIYGLDTVVEKGSTEAIVDALSQKRGGTVITLLPIPEETQKRRKDVHVEFTLVYTELGIPFKFGGRADFPAVPEDKKATGNYVANEMPALLEGWKAGEGSPKLKTQKLRKMDGGLENVIEGFNIMKEGKYGREKLVYTIA